MKLIGIIFGLAMATTFQGDRDMLVEANHPGTDLDPSCERGLGGKVGFDCTRKCEDFPPRNTIARSALEKMNPARWIQP